MSDLGDFSSYDPDEADSTSETATATGDEPAEDQRADQSTDETSSEFDSPELEPVGADRGVGAIAVSEGLAVAEDERDTSIRAYVTVGNRRAVRIGRYLLATYPDGELLFARVSGLEYAQAFRSDDATEIHARRAMRSNSVDQHDYKFIASLAPIGVLYPEDGELHRRAVDRVPAPETVVRPATASEEIKTGLNIPDSGVFLGHLSVGGERVRTAAEPPTVDYRLNDDYDTGDPLVFRHTLIAGGTGSGKTHAAKNILRQFLRDDRTYPVEAGAGREVQPAVVMFDPQDEYAQLHDDNPEVGTETERDWDRQGVVSGGHEQTTAFVPKIGTHSYTASHHDAEQLEFTIPFSMVASRPWLVAGAKLNDTQYGALRYLLGRFFESQTLEGTYEQFRSFLDDTALREELDESGRVHEATFDAVKRRVLSVPGRVFDQNAPPITELVSQFVRPGHCSVVPTYHVNGSRATELLALAVSSLLVEEKLSNNPTYERIEETPLIVGMDEAHTFLSEADSVQARHVISKFSDAAKQGRKERLGLFLVTQDPQEIADAVFKQINTTIVLNLGDEDAISSVNVPSALERKIPSMETGQMVVHSPDNSEPVELIGLSNCLTRHGRE